MSSSPETAPARETGRVIHRRETRYQIWLPFAISLIVLIVIFFAIALQPDPLWRERAQAIGDLMYIIFCSFPLLICLLPLYVVIIVITYGANKLHQGSETPLRKVENAAASMTQRVETYSQMVRDRTVSASQFFDPLDKAETMFSSDQALHPDPMISTEESMNDGE